MKDQLQRTINELRDNEDGHGYGYGGVSLGGVLAVILIVLLILWLI